MHQVVVFYRFPRDLRAQGEAIDAHEVLAGLRGPHAYLLLRKALTREFECPCVVRALR